MDKKYYLILQCVQNYQTSESRHDHAFSYCVTDESITQFIVGEEKVKREKKGRYDFLIMNYWEITKEEYDELYEYYG